MERSDPAFAIAAISAAILLSPPDAVIAGASDAANRKAGYQTENFRIRPSISITQKYDDNVFTTDRDTRSDWITLASPSLKVDSTWTRHGLRLIAGAESGTYWKYDREDYLDYWGRTEGRYSVSTNTDLFAALGISNEHEGRDAPDSPGVQLEPTTYRTYDANAGIKTIHGDTTYRAGGTYETLDFGNTPTIFGRIINDDRDRTLVGAGFRAAHRLNENDRVFLQLRYDDRNYDRGQDRLGFKRSSDGYRAAAGLMRDWSGGSELETYLGVINQNYEDKRFGSTTKIDFGGRLTVRLDGGSKITLRLLRSLEETTEPGSPGYLNTSFTGRLDHRVSPRLIPYLSLAYSDFDFLETGRADKTYAAGAGVKYFVTRNTHLVLGARHRSRDSNDKGLPFGSNDFDETSVFLGLTSRLYPLF